MSYVTNTILSFSIMEDEEAMISLVNKYFSDGAYGQTQMGFIYPPGYGWYGGCKALERPTFVAAFNYMAEDEFLKHLRSLPWKEPEWVQVMLCRQNDEEYEMLYPCHVEGKL